MDGSLDVEISKLSAEKNERDRQRLEKDENRNSKPLEYAENKPFSFNIPEHPFNPNDYKFEDWRSIGFSEKQVETILKFQENGGTFRVKEDVKKLYVVDDELFLKLYDVIDLPDSTSSNENNRMDNGVGSPIEMTVNINTATEEELMKISGIGPFFAKQIVELREGYGGIHELNQILEIYRMDREKLSKIKGSLLIDKTDIIRLNINTATRKELNNHKGISWNIANSIVSMREKHGNYKKIDDLLKSILIDRDKLQELKPYLTIK